MTDKDILDLGIASGLVRVITSNIPNNEKYWIDSTIVDPDFYKFARLIEELTIVKVKERINYVYDK
jgi:hypothetical protein